MLATGGPRLSRLDMRELLSLTYSTLVDLLTPGANNGIAAISRVDDLLTQPPWPSEDEWLEGSEAQQGQAAMMEEFGMAAPRRSDGEPDYPEIEV